MDYCPKVYVYVQLSAMYTVAEVESNVLHYSRSEVESNELHLLALL